MLSLLALLAFLTTTPNDYFEHIADGCDGRLTRFEKMPIRVYVQPLPAPQLKPYRQTVQSALDAWQQASDGLLLFAEVQDDKQADIQVFWSHQPPRLQREQRIAEAKLIRLGQSHYRVEIQVNMRQWPSLDLWDPGSVQKAMLHEFGHAVGLWGHSLDRDDVLYYASDSGVPTDRDRRTLKRLYATPNGTAFHSQAIASLEDRLSQRPTDANAHYLLGSVFVDMGDYERAMESLQRALELDPNVASYATRLGMLFEERGDFDAAIEQYTRASRQRPTAALYAMLGTLYLLQEQFEQAADHYRQAMRMSRDDSVLRRNLLAVYHRWSVHLMKAKRYDEAGEVLDQGLNLHGGSPILNYDRAVAYQGNGQYPEAMAQYERTLALDAGFATAKVGIASTWNRMGAQHAEAQEWEEAMECYHRAIEIDPNCWEAQRNIEMGFLQQAWHEYATGNTQDAIAGYQRVLALSPESADAHHDLGLVYLKEKRYAEALESLEQALALKPESTEVQDHLRYARREQWMGQLRGVMLPVFGVLLLAYLLMRWTYRRIERSRL